MELLHIFAVAYLLFPNMYLLLLMDGQTSSSQPVFYFLSSLHPTLFLLSSLYFICPARLIGTSRLATRSIYVAYWLKIKYQKSEPPHHPSRHGNKVQKSCATTSEAPFSRPAALVQLWSFHNEYSLTLTSAICQTAGMVGVRANPFVVYGAYLFTQVAQYLA